MPGGDNNGDNGNRTARGRPPAPFGSGTEDTVAAPLVVSKAPAPPSLTAEASNAPSSQPSEDPSASRSLPFLDRVRYRFLDEVGRGGLGRVFRARDLYLDRQVAVKELIDPGEDAQRRFVREALITARLQHPAIVPIYDAGQSGEEGPFYAMKLVAGRSLADALAEATTLEQRLALLPSVIAVADAMAYAHSEKIIHRDLKPQNVLVGDYGETVLIDWGLAKDLAVLDRRTEADSVGPYRAASSTTETMDGAVLGTPAFMAPEQAIGEDVDERADVYALGAMLYHLGAGVPPHGGASVDEMLVKVATGDIVPLMEREPRIPADLAAVVGKAMQHDPAKRYPTARELAEDLHKFQTGQLVGAKTYTRGERLRRWLRKNRRVVAVASVAFAILTAYGVWSLQRITAERRRAEDEAAHATAAAAEASTQRDVAIAQAMLVRARQYAATGHTAEELAVLRVLARPDAGEASRRLAITEGGLVWKAHQRLAMALGHEVGLAVRSADGSRFVATVPGSLVVWDAATGKELARQPVDSANTASSAPTAARFGKVAAVSPTGRYAVITICTMPGEGCGIAILGDDTFVLRANTRLELRELTTGRAMAEWSGSDRLNRHSLAFAFDDAAFAVRRGDRLELVSGVARRELDLKECPGALAVSPAGDVAAGCGDHIRLVRADGTVTRIFEKLTTKTQPLQLQFTSPNRLLAIADRVVLWDLTRGELRGDGKLPEVADTSAARDEGEDIEWTYLRPNSPPRHSGTAKTPQIRIGATTSIIPRTSLLSPPPRVVPGGAVITLEGSDWQAMTLQHDRLSYALVDNLVPSEPPERCLGRIGGERHAAITLDGGARLLVDEQELAAGLDVAPPEGYRHTTTAEVPVRQLRPLLAAEADACLVWGSAIGAHVLDGGEVTPGARVIDDGEGGLVLLDQLATRITRSGARFETPTLTPPVESPGGEDLASIDLDTGTVTIVRTATGVLVRTWTLPKQSGDHVGTPVIRWVAANVLEVDDTLLLPADPKLPSRPPEPGLVTDPHSPFGARIAGNAVVVVRVDDGALVAKHDGSGEIHQVKVLGDGSVVVERGAVREVISLAGVHVKLAPSRGALGELSVTRGYLTSRSSGSVAVWELATGRAIELPAGSRDVALATDEAWTVTGLRKPRLVRMPLAAGSRPREIRLSTAGLPFHHIGTHLQVSPDGRRLTAEYAVTEDLTAIATWDAESGALVWVGPPAARVVGSWVIAGGRAYIPAFDIDAILRDTGVRTNLRVCKDDLRAVPVVPPPRADTYWAPDAACAAATDPRR